MSKSEKDRIRTVCGEGGHYSINNIVYEGIEYLKGIFPEGEANEMNCCLFSTSGVHGTYTTIEDLEENMWNNSEFSQMLTVLVIHPRIVNMCYGRIKIKLEDIEYLKKLRQSSWDVLKEMGKQ